MTHPESPETAGPLQEKPAPKKVYAFVKNIHRAEELKLDDGSSFIFPSSFFSTTDEVLAKNLIKIAERHSIVVSN